MVWPFGSKSATSEKPSLASPSEFVNDASSPAVTTTTGSSSASTGTPELPSFMTDIDLSTLHPLAGLGNDLQILDFEDDALSSLPGSNGIFASRGFVDDLCYGTGFLYLGGLGIGGVYGFAEGLRQQPPNAPAKLKLNSVLNGITRRGPFLGNTTGVLAISYNMINGFLDVTRSYHDIYNSVVAGALTGGFYRLGHGFRPMAISAAVMGGTMGLWNYINSAF
ncbi:Tim17/Tim22/Tim23/Pmp24 family-domain-containing protein [Lipomyces oligophaga]|uniref:Tim17/Tim22/Tim23/Pmp24 family-domain-containing protein n=1 Tax=Lipomyces oligophaga TaxID=45792 RepID=UPI0034CF709D